MFFFIGAPFNLLMRLFIPPYDPEDWSRTRAMIFPIFAGMFTFVQFGIYNDWVLTLSIFSVAAICGLIVGCTTKSKRPPSLFILFQILAFVMAVEWVWFLASISVDVIKYFIERTKLPTSYVGLTFMSMANSIADIIPDTTMARQGHSVMALTAAFAGPLFGVMLGIGMTLTRCIIR
jgi:sodium/potassium/calcium exchanger 6